MTPLNRPAPAAKATKAAKTSPAPGPAWSANRRDRVTRFVTVAQQRLRLTDWTVRVDFDTPAGADELATINPMPAQKHATLRLGPLFLALNAHDQRQTLVHELIHCHLFRLSQSVTRMVEQLDENGPRPLATVMLSDEIEWATDALADVFVTLMADQPVPASPPAGSLTAGQPTPIPRRPGTPRTTRTTPAAKTTSAKR